MRAIWLMLGCLTIEGCAAPGCYYPEFSFSQVCPAEQAAAEAKTQAAEQEQQRQELITQLGGLKQYQIYENAQAWKRWQVQYQTMYDTCVQESGIPVTAFQNNYIRQRCGEWALQILGPSKPPILH